MKKLTLLVLIVMTLWIVSACSNGGNTNVSDESQAMNHQHENNQPADEQTANQPAEEQTEQPTEQRVEQAADEPVEQPAQPADQPADLPAEQPAKESGSEAAPKKYTVEIIDFAFEPAVLEIEAGSTVEFINRDAMKHTATGDNGEFDTGLIGKDEAKTVAFEDTGEFGYYCTPHPGMTATIIVK